MRPTPDYLNSHSFEKSYLKDSQALRIFRAASSRVLPFILFVFILGFAEATVNAAPATPTNPSPGSTSSPGPTTASSTVTLSWSASSGATSYGLGVRDIATSVLVVDTNVTGTSYTANLSTGKQYRWNVNACNSTGCSSFTTVLYFQTPAAVTVPAMPSNPGPGSTSSPGPTTASNSVTLSWGGSSGATSYGLGVRDIATSVLVVDTNVTGTSYTANLSAGKQYRWNVNACNSAGCSTYTTPLYFQTPVGSLSITSTAFNPATATVGVGYAANTAMSATGGRTPYSWSATGFPNGMSINSTSGAPFGTPTVSGTFNVTITVRDSNNPQQAASKILSLTVNPPGLPAIPTNPSPGSTSSPGPTTASSSVTLSWSASSGATNYGVAVRDLATNVLVVDTNVSGTSYTANLSAGRQYRWNVNACNSAECSSFTTPLYFVTPGTSDTTPPVISAFSVNAIGIALGDSITISYTISDSGGSGLSRIELYRAPDNAGTPGTWTGLRANSHSGNGPISSSFSDMPPSAGVYWYGLHAIDGAGNVRVEPNPPGPIRVAVGANLSAPTLSSPSNGTSNVGQPVNFSWSAVPGATSYRILVATSAAALPTDPTASACNCVINGTPGGTSYSASGLSSGTTYYWEVHARSSSQYGTWSVKSSFSTANAADTTAPTISQFYGSPSSINSGSSFAINYSVSDTGGSGLSRVELWRATDNGGTPGSWSQVRTNSLSGDGPVNGSFSDAQSNAGGYWYGLHVFDRAGNVRYEPHPLGPFKVVAIATTQCGNATDIKTRIQKQLLWMVNNPALEYLPGSSWQAALASFNLQAYDEAYYSALDLRGQATSALARASRFVNAGDLDSACVYLRRGEIYSSIMIDTERTAVLIFNNRITGISEIAKTIASKSCELDAAIFTHVYLKGLGPKASLAADTVCLAVDYGLDRSMYGKEEALRILKERLRTEVVAKVIIGTIPVKSLGGKTIEEYLGKGVSHEIGSSRLYSLLNEVISNPVTKQELMKAISILGEKAVIDYGPEKLADEFLMWLADSLQIPAANLQSQDGTPSSANAVFGAAETTPPQILATSPTRNAAYISSNLSTISVTFGESVSVGSRTLVISDVTGKPVAISGQSITNDSLSVTLASQLTDGNVYAVTLPSDTVRNASNAPNDEYRWSFSTPPAALKAGTNVVVANTGGVGISVRSAPALLADGSNIVATFPEGQRLQISGDPVQADGFTWWNVKSGGASGWCPTGDWLSPNDLGGLRIGAGVAIKGTGDNGLTLRDAPTVTAATLMTLSDGTNMQIVSGPYYVDGFLWWNIAGDSASGYVPVAYWLFPLNETTTNTIDQANFFVAQHYTDFLSRQPDASGLNFWAGGITTCGTDEACAEVKRIDTSAAFFLSIEFQETGYLVYRMYKAAYGNMQNAPVPITFSQYLTDTQPIRNGVIVNQGNWQQQLETNKQNFALEFVQRTRFIAEYPTAMTPQAFVDQLFARAGVAPSSSDHAAAIAEFASAADSANVDARARALRDVAENATSNSQEFNRAFVLMQYFGYLRRNPYDAPEPTLDYQGYNFWLSKLNQFNGNYKNAEMVKAFISSIEYRQRFGP